MATPPPPPDEPTTGPGAPPPGPGYGRAPFPGYTVGSGGSLARLPILGNAEFVLWLIVEIAFFIVVAASDFVNMHDWLVATTWVTAAYLISRGVAKASRVLER